MDKEVAKLWLYENTITTSTTAIGVKNAAQTSYTWFVNMREVLGETLFKKYDAFQVLICSLARINAEARVYCDGLNLIQTSKDGQMQGGAALIQGPVKPYGTQDSYFLWDCYVGSQMYIMTKPVDNRIPLTIYWEPTTGANGTSTYGSWFLTFQGLKNYNPLYKNPFNTFHNLEQRTFTLTTQALVAGTTNEYGTMAADYNSFTLTNINFRNILGRMWDKYEKFNLIMTSWSCGITTTGSTISGDQRYIYAIIEGLQFINNVAVGPSSTTSIGRYGIGGAGFIESSGGANNSALGNLFDNMSACNTFRKPESENVSLRFTFGSITQYPMTSFAFNNWAINFMIVGVNESE
jgi:hypothetical protein